MKKTLTYKDCKFYNEGECAQNSKESGFQNLCNLRNDCPEIINTNFIPKKHNIKYNKDRGIQLRNMEVDEAIIVKVDSDQDWRRWQYTASQVGRTFNVYFQCRRLDDFYGRIIRLK